MILVNENEAPKPPCCQAGTCRDRVDQRIDLVGTDRADSPLTQGSDNIG